MKLNPLIRDHASTIDVGDRHTLSQLTSTQTRSRLRVSSLTAAVVGMLCMTVAQAAVNQNGDVSRIGDLSI